MISATVTVEWLARFAKHRTIRPGEINEHAESIIAEGWKGAPPKLTLRPGAVPMLNDAHRRLKYLAARGHGKIKIPVQIL